MTLKDYIRDIPNFPTTGITYRDISPVLQDPLVFRHAIDSLLLKVRDMKIDRIVGIESKGLIFAAPLSLQLGIGMSVARKRTGDHPLDVVGIDYALQMGTHRIEMMRDAVKKGENILIVDDLLATGVTARATADLVQQLGGNVVAFAFLAEINYYDGAANLTDIAPVLHVYDC
ncbi:MAG: adenine phosphoribosyltransferase [Bacteroidetes bacterium]|nr:adenine phosphoribosyltransferase [Bacteroidota bacterium]